MIAYSYLVVGFFALFVLVNSVILALAGVQVRRYVTSTSDSALRRMLRSPLTPPVSILVPAFNEAAVIVDSVRSLLALDYRELEVVVVNDGSTDDTLARLIETFGLRSVRRPTPPFLPHAPVRGVYAPDNSLRLLVIDKENGGGKADTLNAGINFASFPLFCSMDADSILEQDAIARAVLPFVDDPERTVASGGLIRIANGCLIEYGRVVRARLPTSAYAMFQVLEYLRGFFGSRTGWSAINALLIVSGAFGVFRRDLVIEVGGYRTDIVGEDLELVTRLHRICRRAGRPYRIVYVPEPICWTEAPQTARALRSQRRRWYRGSVETLLIHWRMLGNPRYRAVGLVALPALLLFEVLGPVIELSGYLVTAAAFLVGTLSAATFVLFVAVSVLYGLILTIGAIALEDASPSMYPAWAQLRRLWWYAVIENFGYRQLMQIWRLGGIWQLIRKTRWEPLERRGLSA
ncbi:MAG: glycosyltransferase family 2 protein [Streptosporangiaceae bacterium]